VNFSNGEIELIRNVSNSGCGIRVLVEGCWGFSSTSNISTDALKNALYDAISIAKLLSESKKKKVKGLAEVKQMAKGHLNAKVKGNLENIDIEQKLKLQATQNVRHEIIPKKINRRLAFIEKFWAINS
jgi:TldD protein